MTRYGYSFEGERKAKIINKWIGMGNIILDLGARDCHLTQHFANGNDIFAIDIDETGLSYCAQYSIKAIVCDINESLPFDSQTFDVVLANEVLEHTHRPTFLLNDIKRILKKGGHFIGSVPNAHRLKNKIVRMVEPGFAKDPSHIHEFKVSEMYHMLKNHFKVVNFSVKFGKMAWYSGRLFGNSIMWRVER